MSARRRRAKSAALAVLPLVVLAGILAILLFTRPLDELTASAPPVEKLQRRSARLDARPDLARRARRRLGPGAASRRCRSTAPTGSSRRIPPGPIGRLGTRADRHSLSLGRGRGAPHRAPHRHRRDLRARRSRWRRRRPRWDAPTLLALLALVGLLLGLAPVATGLLAYPALRALGRGAIRFVLALTVGLLAYLLIDTLSEGLEAAGEAIERLPRADRRLGCRAAHRRALLLAHRPPAADARPKGLRSRSSSRSASACTISAKASPSARRIAAGEAALATFLVIGFTIHNVSEGFGIATPLIGRRPSLRRLRRACARSPGCRRCSASGSARRRSARSGSRSASASAPARSCR